LGRRGLAGAKSAASRAASAARARLPTRVTELADTAKKKWDKAPREARLVVKGVAVVAGTSLFAPAAAGPVAVGIARFLGVAAAAHSEAPQAASEVLLGKGVATIGGVRRTIKGPDYPQHPLEPLHELHAKIQRFERLHPPHHFKSPLPPLVLGEPPQAPREVPAVDEAPAAAAAEAAEPGINLAVNPEPTRALLDKKPPTTAAELFVQTNKNIDLLSERLSAFGSLFVMHTYICGIKGDTQANLLKVVHEATTAGLDGKKPSLWKIFKKHYGKDLTFIQRAKSWLFYVLSTWIPIIPRTVDAYLKNILNVVRAGFKKEDNRTALSLKLLDNVSNFLHAYNGSVEAYSTSTIGNLDHYRKQAIDTLVGKTTEQLCDEFSRSFLDHFATKVPFGFCEGILNKIIHYVLKKKVVPTAVRSVFEKGEEETKKYKVPFQLAITKALIEQFEKLQIALKKPSSGPLAPLPGSEKLGETTANLLLASELIPGVTETPMQAKQKLDELKENSKKPQDPIKTQVRDGIKDGIKQGGQFLLHYLRDEGNIEGILANITDLLDQPFSGVAEENADTALEAADMQLQRIRREVLITISDKAVSALLGDPKEDLAAEKSAAEAGDLAFEGHKQLGTRTVAHLEEWVRRMRQKVTDSGGVWNEAYNILPQLGAFTAELKRFEESEIVEKATGQLPRAEMQAVLIPIHPLYKLANQLMDPVMQLQEHQRFHERNTQLAGELAKIRDKLKEVKDSNNPAQMVQALSVLEESAKKIYAMLPEDTNDRKQSERKQLETCLKRISDKVAKYTEEQKTLDALAALQPFPEEGEPASPIEKGLLGQLLLKAERRSPANFVLWRCIEAIQANLSEAILDMNKRNTIIDQIERLNKHDSGPGRELKEIWEKLGVLLKAEQKDLTAKREVASKEIGKFLPDFLKWAEEQTEVYEQQRETNGQTLNEQLTKLEKGLAELKKGYAEAHKEDQHHATQAELRNTTLAIGATASAIPFAGPALSAVAAATGTYALHNPEGAERAARYLPPIPVPKTAAQVAMAVAGASLAVSPVAYGINCVAGAIGGPLGEAAASLALGAAGTLGSGYVGHHFQQKAHAFATKTVQDEVIRIADVTHDNLLKSDIVYYAGMRLSMKAFIETFPPN
jgi:hypothetical protein